MDYDNPFIFTGRQAESFEPPGASAPTIIRCTLL